MQPNGNTSAVALPPRCLAPVVGCLSALLVLAACNSRKPSPAGSHQASEGAPCTSEARDAGDANFACSTDKAQELVCDPVTRKLKVWAACRGRQGCSFEDGVVLCDQKTARAGEPCHPANTHACSEDGGAELQCSAELGWTLQSPCKLAGCQVKSDAVFCE